MNVKDMRAALQRQLDAEDPAIEAASQGIPADTAALVQNSKAFRASRSKAREKASPQMGSARSRSNAAKRRTSASA